MKKIIIGIVFLVFSVFLFGKDENIKKLGNVYYSNEINVKDISLENFLLFLSEESGVTVISSQKIKNDKISLYINENKNFFEILDILCNSQEYMIKDRGNYIYISSRFENKENKGILVGRVTSDDFGENLEKVKVTLLDGYSKPNYTSSDGVYKIDDISYGVYFLRVEKEGYDTVGEIITIDKSHNILNINLKKKYQAIKKQEISKKQFVVKKVKVGDLENLKIEEFISDELKNNVKLTRDNKKNILYISGREEKVDIVKENIEKICHSNKGIRISAQILDITDNLFEELGFSWIYGANEKGYKGNQLVGGSLNNSYIGGIGSIFTTTFNYIKTFKNNEDYLNFGINLLKSTQDLKISSTPVLVTSNGEEASLKVILEQIVGQERVENTDNNQNTYIPIFREAGIILKVLPEILDDEYISLKVSIESSDFKILNENTSSETDGENNYGGKVSRNIESTLRIKNGETVFLSGLKKGVVQKNQSKVPFLGDIPVIGFFFSNNRDIKQVTDLYIRLRVDVIENKGFQGIDMKNFEKID